MGNASHPDTEWLSVNLDTKLKRRVKRRAAADNLGMSAWVRRLIERELNGNRASGKST